MMTVGLLMNRRLVNGRRTYRRLRMAGRAAALFVTLLAFQASSGYGQVRRPAWAGPVAAVTPPDAVERGWMGVGVEVTVLERERGPANVEVRVVRTVDGGPAAVAGVVLGDVIRAINGELLTTERWQTFTQNLRPGVDLRLVLDRAGRNREISLRTAPRPSVPPVPTGLTDHLDSVRTSFQFQLESNRDLWASRDHVRFLIAGDSVEATSTRILAETRRNAGTYGFRPGSAADLMAPSRRSSNRYSVVWNTDAALPLEYLMLQSPEADSVKEAIIVLRGALSVVVEATRAREQEISGIVRVRDRDLDRDRDFGDNDEQLVRLRSDNERVQEDLERLAVRLVEIGSNERETRREAAGFEAELAEPVRPVTAHLVGRNFVGGAQFNDVNPQLGTYFGTDHGVLVIQVLAGTPCDEAGLVPGDVVTHVGDTEIDNVEGFRAVLNQVFSRRRQAELTLMRKGERVEASLSR